MVVFGSCDERRAEGVAFVVEIEVASFYEVIVASSESSAPQSFPDEYPEPGITSEGDGELQTVFIV